MKDYTTIAELIRLANEEGGIYEAVLASYADAPEKQEEAIARMRESLEVMRDSIREGLNPDARSVSGLVGGQSARLLASVKAGINVGGRSLGLAAAYALAAAECNACMGRIVAAPTAGACGVLPAVLFEAQDEKGYDDEALVRALFVAAGFGRVIASRAGISGAEGGCQMECGTASAMAAAAVTYLAGGTAEMCACAMGFALMNLMGLVCDPVGGLVEVPCVYRNVVGASNALSAASLALAGLTLIMPEDEIIDAMRRVGHAMPSSLRETGEGGCAACKLKESCRD